MKSPIHYIKDDIESVTVRRVPLKPGDYFVELIEK